MMQSWVIVGGPWKMLLGSSRGHWHSSHMESTHNNCPGAWHNELGLTDPGSSQTTKFEAMIDDPEIVDIV